MLGTLSGGEEGEAVEGYQQGWSLVIKKGLYICCGNGKC